MNQKNKLRRGKNVKVMIYMGVIGFVILLCCGLYLALMMLDFKAATGEEIAMNVDSLMSFFTYLGSPKMKVPINLLTVFTCFKYQITKLWWLYSSLQRQIQKMNSEEWNTARQHGQINMRKKCSETIRVFPLV